MRAKILLGGFWALAVAGATCGQGQRLLNLTELDWGLGTSAYQVEGAAQSDGRDPSIWDEFCNQPGIIADNSTGAVAVNQYNLYTQDVQLLASLGVEWYRFSISWSRLIKNAGGPQREVNPAGVKYYNDLINELLANGIQPMVTLYHWDLPVTNWMNATFWLRSSSVTTPEFVYYADAAFRLFGDRVKAWSTFNEPWTFAMMGYGWGVHAPGLKEGETGVWQVGHNVLLAHAAAVQRYRIMYRHQQKGRIGMNLNTDWAEPASDKAEDVDAAQLSNEFRLAWFADPLYHGDYPQSMRLLLGDRLPRFTAAQKRRLKGSTDYFALNHYTAYYASSKPYQPNDTWETQFWHSSQEGIGAASASEWLKVVPWSFRKLLVWTSERYGFPEIWITEQGVSGPGEGSMAAEQVSRDEFRVEFYRGYLAAMQQAMSEDGVRVAKYMAWSLLDNFEWAKGFTERFGVVHVDPSTQVRTVKASAHFLRDVFVHGNASAAAQPTAAVSTEAVSIEAVSTEALSVSVSTNVTEAVAATAAAATTSTGAELVSTLSAAPTGLDAPAGTPSP